MSRIDDATEVPAAGSEAGRTLWRRSLAAEMPDDEAERFLDLAALADGTLDDDDEHGRVVALVAADPVAAVDVAAARALSTGGIAMPGGVERVLGRAVALVTGTSEPARIIPFARPPKGRRVLHDVAQWGGLAAAIAVASWLGFAMGSGASLTLSAPGLKAPAPQRAAGEVNFLPELLDPSTGFLRDLGSDGQQT
jgi:hypothetical protein